MEQRSNYRRFNGISSRCYSVTITESNGCTVTGTTSFTITQPTSLAAAITTQTNVNCFGNNTGSATVTPSDGTFPIPISWDTVPVQTNATATGLTSGIYNVTVTDANLCAITKTVTITQPAIAVSVSGIATNVSCYGLSNGSITVSNSSGSTVVITNASNIAVPSTSLPAGIYTLTATAPAVIKDNPARQPHQ